MPRSIVLFPPPPDRTSWGVLASLIAHLPFALALVLPRAADAPRDDPIDRLVVFLVPPAEEPGRQAVGRELPWHTLHGDQGAVEEPMPPTDTEERLTVGRVGEPDTTEAEPAGEELPAIEEAFTEIEVDSVVERDPTSAAPVYPAEMLQKQLEGSTFVHYVVDTTGRVDTATIRVVRSTHPAFSQSVRDALALMRFRPAIQRSRKVRQWVEQNFSFRILPRSPAADTT